MLADGFDSYDWIETIASTKEKAIDFARSSGFIKDKIFQYERESLVAKFIKTEVDEGEVQDTFVMEVEEFDLI